MVDGKVKYRTQVVFDVLHYYAEVLVEQRQMSEVSRSEHGWTDPTVAR